MRKVFLACILVISFFSVPAQSLLDAQIRDAVQQQIQRYPKSTLQDLYKNFVQERFGSEHLISDTANVGAYLDNELLQTFKDTVNYYESIGLHGDYYRVNLYVVKAGMVPRNVLFRAFLESAQSNNRVTVREWTTEWAHIDSVIAAMNLSLVNYSRDSKALRKMLLGGHYAVHHSIIFEESYYPHYRIVRKDIFEQDIFPYLKAYSSTPKVLGIGGIFFFTTDPNKTKEWYRDNLGIETDEWGATFLSKNMDDSTKTERLQWSPFPQHDAYFAPSEKDFMINYRVQNLEGMVKLLKAKGVVTLDNIETYDFGKFVHIMDNDGNKIELWEPVENTK